METVCPRPQSGLVGKLAPDALTPLQDNIEIAGMSDVGLHSTGPQAL